MNAEIIAVGTELLLGEIVNTNAKFLAEELSSLGINVYYQTVVGDNHDRLLDTIRTALWRSDIVITSGGLGPTHDDITKETLAEMMGIPLEMHDESLQRIKNFYVKMNKPMPKVNEKQAMMPAGCTVLRNNHGTAPGGIIEKDGKIAIFLPGPPRELEPMFREKVFRYLREKSKEMLYSKVLRIHGMGESAVEEKLADMMKHWRNPTVAPYAKDDETTLRITAKCADESDGEILIIPIETQIRAILGDAVYGTGNDSLCRIAMEELRKRKMTIAFAESCTGGMIASQLTDIPGASAVFCESVITYSNEAKIRYLSVSRDTLKKHGAVSSEVAYEMADGMKRRSLADMVVSATGIAGPEGEGSKPVGLEIGRAHV